MTKEEMQKKLDDKDKELKSCKAENTKLKKQLDAKAQTDRRYELIQKVLKISVGLLCVFFGSNVEGAGLESKWVTFSNSVVILGVAIIIFTFFDKFIKKLVGVKNGN